MPLDDSHRPPPNELTPERDAQVHWNVDEHARVTEVKVMRRPRNVPNEHTDWWEIRSIGRRFRYSGGACNASWCTGPYDLDDEGVPMNARALLLDLIFGYGFVSAEAARQCLDEFLKIEGFKKRFPPLRSAPAGWSPFALQREQNHRRLYENHDHP